jgi:hypothetical protein
MLLQAFNLGILTLLFFVAGMIKPKWPLFFMEKPTRFLIVIITTVLFMVVMTMYGQGSKEASRVKKKAAVATQSEAPKANLDAVPVPVPMPAATPTPSAKKL